MPEPYFGSSLLCRFVEALFAVALFSSAVSSQTQPVTGERTVAADYARVKGRHDTFFCNTVGAGRAAEGLRAD